MRAALLAVLVAVGASQACPNIPTVDTINIAHYTGRWYVRLSRRGA